MKIVFSDHSKKQNLIRKIPKKFILETVKNPRNKMESFKNRQLLQRKFGGKILEVVIATEDDSLTVVTQYWLEKEEL